jgi:hypothetical protein
MIRAGLAKEGSFEIGRAGLAFFLTLGCFLGLNKRPAKKRFREGTPVVHLTHGPFFILLVRDRIACFSLPSSLVLVFFPRLEFLLSWLTVDF